MGYREVSVVQVREILRLWVRGHRVRAIARLTQTDRKTPSVSTLKPQVLRRIPPSRRVSGHLHGWRDRRGLFPSSIAR